MNFLNLLSEADGFTQILFSISLIITVLMALGYTNAGGFMDEWYIGLIDARDAYTWEFTALFAVMLLITSVLFVVAF